MAELATKLVAPEVVKLAQQDNLVVTQAPKQQVVQAQKDAMAHTSQEVMETAEDNKLLVATIWMAPEEEQATMAAKVATQMPEQAVEDQATATRATARIMSSFRAHRVALGLARRLCHLKLISATTPQESA